MSKTGGSKGSKRTRNKVIRRDGGICRYCGEATVARVPLLHRRHDDRTLDHVIPVCLGGPSTVENLVVACYECNQIKGNQPLATSGMVLLPAPYPDLVDSPARQRPPKMPPWSLPPMDPEDIW